MTVSLLMASIVAGVWHAGPQVPVPRVALVYSDYGNFRHRDDYDARMRDMAWPMDKYENTQFGRLAAKLDRYDIVLGSALYNYSNAQDFSKYWRQMEEFMRRGGAFVFTDANYSQHVQWLAGVGEGYQVSVERCASSGKEAKLSDANHPLMNFPLAWRPRAIWSHMRVGPKWRVLARCPDGGVIWALADFGPGFIWLSSFWPLSKPQLTDLWEYVRMRRAGVEIVEVSGIDHIRPGRCTARTVLRLLASAARTAGLRVSWHVLQPGGKELAAKGEVARGAEAGQVTAVMSLRCSRRGRHLSWLRVALPSGEPYVSKPIEVTVPELIEARLTSAVYRNAIYLGIKPTQIRIRATAHPFDEDLRGAVFRWVVAQGDRVVAAGEGKPPLESGQVREYAGPVGDIVPGAATVRAALEKAGRRLWSKRWRVDVVERRRPQVALGGRLETYVDGRPFFPIGIYHIARKYYDQARSMGFNCVQAWGTTVEGARAALDAAHEKGLKVILEMTTLLRGKYRPEEVRRIVRACRRHPALLAWYPVDEPGPGHYERCVDAYRIFREEDPDHPVYLVMCDPARFGQFAGATDILAIDPYPIPRRSVEMVAGWMRAAQEAVRGEKAVWLIPQLHNIAAYRDASKGRAPTPAEEWCMVALGLVYGAKGIVYYPWDDRKCGLVHEKELMAELPRINRFLAQVGGEMARATRVEVEVRPEAEGVHAAAYRGERLLLIAANAAKKPNEVELRLPVSGGTARSLLDDRRWPISNGRVRVRLEPLTVLAAEVR